MKLLESCIRKISTVYLVEDYGSHHKNDNILWGISLAAGVKSALSATYLTHIIKYLLQDTNFFQPLFAAFKAASLFWKKLFARLICKT